MTAATAAPLHWRAQARCVDVPPSVFFPADPVTEARAVAICQTCPVKDPCRSWAHTHGERHGVWGGETEAGRAYALGSFVRRSTGPTRHHPQAEAEATAYPGSWVTAVTHAERVDVQTILDSYTAAGFTTRHTRADPPSSKARARFNVEIRKPA